MNTKQIKTYLVVSLGDGEDLLLEELNGINSDDKALVIQIYGHAGASGIQGHDQGEVYTWDRVVELVSLTRKRYPIRLDLCGLCNSHFIGRFIKGNTPIDEIWASTRETDWQSIYNVSGSENSFEDFTGGLDEEDESLKEFYVKIK